MSLVDYSLKEPIFIDANIFLYNALDHPKYGEICTEFLRNVENNDVIGVVTPLVIEEVLFKILVAEASKYIEKPLLSTIRKNMKNTTFSKKVYKVLREYRNYLLALSLSSLKIIEVDAKTAMLSVDIGEQFGLLTSDAVHASSMKLNNISNIATNDPDFDRVDFLHVWKP